MKIANARIGTDVGNNKEISCNSCKILMHRDYNGARNVLLKHLEML